MKKAILPGNIHAVAYGCKHAAGIKWSGSCAAFVKSKDEINRA
jgi:hypothetical protein